MSEARTDLLVLAAHTPDLRGLRDALGDRLRGEVAGIAVCAKTVGLGLAAAGGAASRRIVTLRPRAVVLVGTAGLYPELPGYQPEDVIVPDRLSLCAAGVLEGKARFPDPMETSCDTSGAICHGLGGAGGRAHIAPVACPVAQTTDPALAARIQADTAAHAENLEAFAVAQACRLAEVPFAAALGVSHLVGPAAAQDFARFQQGAAVAAAQTVVGWLSRGGAGIPHGH